MRNLILITKTGLLLVLVIAGFGVSGQSIQYEKNLKLGFKASYITFFDKIDSGIKVCGYYQKPNLFINNPGLVANQTFVSTINSYGDTISTRILDPGLGGAAIFPISGKRYLVMSQHCFYPNTFDTIMYRLSVWDSSFVSTFSVPLSPWHNRANDLFNNSGEIVFDRRNNSLYIVSRTIDTSVGQYEIPKIWKYDSSGNLLWAKVIPLTGYLPYPYPIITNGGNLCFTAYLQGPNGLNIPFILLVNENGDVIVSRSLNALINPSLTALFPNPASSSFRLTQLANGDYLTYRRASDGLTMTYHEIAIYDSSFLTKKWFYVNKQRFFNPHFVAMSDGGFLMNADTGNGQKIYKMDSLGNVDWVLQFNSQIAGTITISNYGAVIDDSGNVFIAGSNFITSLRRADAWYAYVRGMGFPHKPSIGVINIPPNITALKPSLPREYTAQPQPNPTSNRFTIPGVGREGVLSLVNASGRVVRQESFVPGSEVDISALPKGLYLFRLVSEGAVTQGKVVRE